MASLACNPTNLTFMRIFGVFEEATNLVGVGLVGEEDNKWILGHFRAIKVRRQEELRAHRQPGGRTCTLDNGHGIGSHLEESSRTREVLLGQARGGKEEDEGRRSFCNLYWSFSLDFTVF